MRCLVSPCSEAVRSPRLFLDGHRTRAGGDEGGAQDAPKHPHVQRPLLLRDRVQHVGMHGPKGAAAEAVQGAYPRMDFWVLVAKPDPSGFRPPIFQSDGPHQTPASLSHGMWENCVQLYYNFLTDSCDFAF